MMGLHCLLNSSVESIMRAAISHPTWLSAVCNYQRLAIVSMMAVVNKSKKKQRRET